MVISNFNILHQTLQTTVIFARLLIESPVTEIKLNDNDDNFK